MPPMLQDLIAFDRAPSARTIDDDGHLHVSDVPISKANVCGYRGSEIPDCAGLGLDPGRVYQLLRHPDELAKAADTFNGKPLLNLHKPQTADDHDHGLHVGSVHNVFWDPPYLKAGDMHVLDGESIAGIETGAQRQLSSSYRYDADMTPGTYEGTAYDGVMRNIRGNHVALVEKGRAGPDVFVHDAAPPAVPIPPSFPQVTFMAKTAVAPSRAAILALGTLANYSRTKLAADKALDLAGVVRGLTRGNFADQAPTVAARFKAATLGKLAADADLDDLIDTLEKVAPLVDALSDDPEDTAPDGATPAIDDDADMMTRVTEFLTGKISDEDLDTLKGMMKPEVTAEPDAPAEDDKPAAEPKKPAMDAHPRKETTPMVSKTAMDAALRDNTRDTIAKINAMHEARTLVRPLVGEVVAMDSAESVLRFALEAKGYKPASLAGVPAHALTAMVENLPRPDAAPRRAPVAMDAAAVDRRTAMFPNATRLSAI